MCVRCSLSFQHISPECAHIENRFMSSLFINCIRWNVHWHTFSRLCHEKCECLALIHWRKCKCGKQKKNRRRWTTAKLCGTNKVQVHLMIMLIKVSKSCWCSCVLHVHVPRHCRMSVVVGQKLLPIYLPHTYTSVWVSLHWSFIDVYEYLQFVWYKFACLGFILKIKLAAIRSNCIMHTHTSGENQRRRAHLLYVQVKSVCMSRINC